MTATTVPRAGQPTPELPPQPTRRTPSSWLWLAVGGVLLSFTVLQPVIPVAAWLAPVFLLRFARTRRASVALPALALVGYLAGLVAFRGVLPVPGVFMLAATGVVAMLPYAADLLIASRVRGIPRTLVLPLADTALTFLFSQGGFGTMGAAAYTQVGNLALTQMVAVTGIWGLGFLIAWAASVVNELWEGGFDLRRARRSVGLLAVVALVVLAVGAGRVAFFPPAAPTVRVAALAPDRTLDEAARLAGDAPRPLGAPQRAQLHERYLAPVLDDLFDRTRQAARGGARIVVWAEAAGFAFKEDEAALISRARQVAREEGVYLQITPGVLLPTTGYPFIEIRAILIAPDGTVAWDYPKASVPLNDGNLPGPGVVPTVDTPFGRLATVICFDASFPALVRQAGQARADILLVSSSDWAEVTEALGRTAALRAVENGVSLVRPVRRGTSLAVDHQGRLLGYKPDYFVADDQTMVVNVPTRGTATPYARIGDAAAYLALVGFLVLAGSTLRSRTASSARSASKASPRGSRPRRRGAGDPSSGEQNDEVYGKLLGLSEDERARLHADGVI